MLSTVKSMDGWKLILKKNNNHSNLKVLVDPLKEENFIKNNNIKTVILPL